MATIKIYTTGTRVGLKTRFGLGGARGVSATGWTFSLYASPPYSAIRGSLVVEVQRHALLAHPRTRPLRTVELPPHDLRLVAYQAEVSIPASEEPR